MTLVKMITWNVFYPPWHENFSFWCEKQGWKENWKIVSRLTKFSWVFFSPLTRGWIDKLSLTDFFDVFFLCKMWRRFMTFQLVRLSQNWLEISAQWYQKFSTFSNWIYIEIIKLYGVIAVYLCAVNEDLKGSHTAVIWIFNG